MGINDRAQNRKDEKLAAKQARRKLRDSSGKGGTPADWASADGDLLSRLAAVVSADGGAVRLGYTRDGGAYAIGIYGDGDPYTVYVSPSEDLNEWIRSAIEDFESN